MIDFNQREIERERESAKQFMKCRKFSIQQSPRSIGRKYQFEFRRAN